MTSERLELLDLFYGVNGKVLSMQEIADMYHMDYIKMHDKISDAREAAIIINAGMDRGLDIDKSLYVPYVLDRGISFTLETRYVLKLFIVDNKIVPGGVGGIAVIVNNLLVIDNTITIIVLKVSILK